MKRILSFLLMVGLFLSIAACGQKQMSEENDKNETETSSDDKINESQEDTDKIELSIDNFTDFFTYTKGLERDSKRQYRDAYTIQGVLDFAYYKDVVITFEVTYQVSGNEVKTTYMTHTNAAGDVFFFENDAAKSLGISTYSNINFEVKSVSGTVHLYH